MRRNLLLRLGALAASLLAASVLMLGPAATPARALSPASRLVVWLQRLPRQVVIDGHCRIVDGNGVPLTDSLSWQRTGHDDC
ncbi:MAG TPA: hypothetical protein VG779_11775 [Actinomycetota bacterium]|jgi:hypothetical protein|nr:hypothetical protein [Actinomycetota bacterium]